MTSQARSWSASKLRSPAVACSTQAASRALTAPPRPPLRLGVMHQVRAERSKQGERAVAIGAAAARQEDAGQRTIAAVIAHPTADGRRRGSRRRRYGGGARRRGGGRDGRARRGRRRPADVVGRPPPAGQLAQRLGRVGRRRLTEDGIGGVDAVAVGADANLAGGKCDPVALAHDRRRRRCCVSCQRQRPAGGHERRPCCRRTPSATLPGGRTGERRQQAVVHRLASDAAAAVEVRVAADEVALEELQDRRSRLGVAPRSGGRMSAAGDREIEVLLPVGAAGDVAADDQCQVLRGEGMRADARPPP